MKRLDMSQSKILFVINKNKTLYGSITDGDIRRWILKNNNIDAKIEKFAIRILFHLMKIIISKI